MQDSEGISGTGIGKEQDMEILLGVMTAVVLVMGFVIFKLFCYIWFLGKVLEEPTIEKQEEMLNEYYKQECLRDLGTQGGF